MSEWKSKCCGAEVEFQYRESIDYDLDMETGEETHWAEKYYECSKCHKPCDVEKKEKEEGNEKR